MLAGSISVCGSRSTKPTKRNVTRGILAAAAAILLASGCSTSASLTASDDQVITSGEAEASTSVASSPATSSTLEAPTLAPVSNDQTDSPEGGEESTESTGSEQNTGSDESTETEQTGEESDEQSSTPPPENPDIDQQTPDEAPLKQPVTFSGSGPDVIGIDPGSALDSTRWIMEVTHDGTGGFQVTAVDSYGKPMDQIVYTIGSYQGRSSFSFGRYDPPDAIEVVADGNWTLTFTDPRTLDSIDTADGTVFKGSGNDVYRFETGGESKGIEFVCETCTANINLYSLGEYDWREEGVLISETGQGSRFAKVVLVPVGTEYLEIALASNDPETGQFIPNDWSITVY